MALEKFPDQSECPLCMEPLEMDDINFYPCTCGYQICRFCWHRIRTNENGLCPACRKQYPEDPAEYKPLTAEELQKIKNEKRQKDIQKKQKVSESRKLLSQVRVVQKNLVFIVGLTQKLADPEVLKKNEYFGRFGKIHKIVINTSTSYAGSGGPTASAYITFVKMEDALRAIQYINHHNTMDGRIIKSSLGTTKYCSHFLKGSSCPKTDCMYLHEMGEEGASFTKEEMQAGRHQEYEMRLLEQTLPKDPTTTPINPSPSQHQANHNLSITNYPGHHHPYPPGMGVVNGMLGSMEICESPTTPTNDAGLQHNNNATTQLLSSSLPASFLNDGIKLTANLDPDGNQQQQHTGQFIENNNTRYYYTNSVDLDHHAQVASDKGGIGPKPTSFSPPPSPSFSGLARAPSTSPNLANNFQITGDGWLEQTSNVRADLPHNMQNGHVSDGSGGAAPLTPFKSSNKLYPGAREKGEKGHHNQQPEDPVSQDDALLKISQSLSLQMELIFKKKMAAAAAAAAGQGNGHQPGEQDQPAQPRHPNTRHYNHQHQQHLQPNNASPPAGSSYTAEDDPYRMSSGARKIGHMRHLSGPGMCDTTSLISNPRVAQPTVASTLPPPDPREPLPPSDRMFKAFDINTKDDIINYINGITGVYGGNPPVGSPATAAAAYNQKHDPDELVKMDDPSRAAGLVNQHTQNQHQPHDDPTQPQHRYQILLRDGQRKVLGPDLSNDNFSDHNHPHQMAGNRPDLDNKDHMPQYLVPQAISGMPHSLRALSAERVSRMENLSSASRFYKDDGLTEPKSRPTLMGNSCETDAHNTNALFPLPTTQGAIEKRVVDDYNDKDCVDSSNSMANATFPDWQEAFGFGPSQKHIEDDLGFDPWNESTKALAELIQQEQRPHEPQPFQSNNNIHQSIIKQGSQYEQQQHPNLGCYGDNDSHQHHLGLLPHPPPSNNNTNNIMPSHNGTKVSGDDVNTYNFSTFPPSPLKHGTFLPHFDPLLSQFPLGTIPPALTSYDDPNGSFQDGIAVKNLFQHNPTGGGAQTPSSYHQEMVPNDKRFPLPVAPILASPAAAMMLSLLSSCSSSGLPPNNSINATVPPINYANQSGCNAPVSNGNNCTNLSDFTLNNMPYFSPGEGADKNGSFINNTILSNMIQQYMMSNGANVASGSSIAPSLAGGMNNASQAQILARLQQMMAFNSLAVQQEQMAQVNGSSGTGTIPNFCTLLNALTVGINAGLPFQQILSAAASGCATNNQLSLSNSLPSNLNPNNVRPPTGNALGTGGAFLNQNTFSRKFGQFGNPHNPLLGNASTFNFPNGSTVIPPGGGGPTTAPSPFGMKDMAEALKAMSVCHVSANPANNFIQTPSPFLNFGSGAPGNGPLNGFRIPPAPAGSLLGTAAFLNQQQQHHPYEGNGPYQQLHHYKTGTGSVDKCSSITPPAYMEAVGSATAPAPHSPHNLFLRSMLSPPFNQLLSAAAGISPLKFFQHPSQFPLALSSNPYKYNNSNHQNLEYAHDYNSFTNQQQNFNGGQGNNNNGQFQYENNLILDGYNKPGNNANNGCGGGMMMDPTHPHLSPIQMGNQGGNQNYSQQQHPLPQMDVVDYQGHPPPLYLNLTPNSLGPSDNNYQGRPGQNYCPDAPQHLTSQNQNCYNAVNVAASKPIDFHHSYMSEQQQHFGTHYGHNFAGPGSNDGSGLIGGMGQHCQEMSLWSANGMNANNGSGPEP